MSYNLYRVPHTGLFNRAGASYTFEAMPLPSMVCYVVFAGAATMVYRATSFRLVFSK
jgi:hypothetical protein